VERTHLSRPLYPLYLFPKQHLTQSFSSRDSAVNVYVLCTRYDFEPLLDPRFHCAVMYTAGFRCHLLHFVGISIITKVSD
jgi:hypothetical protein